MLLFKTRENSNLVSLALALSLSLSFYLSLSHCDRVYTVSEVKMYLQKKPTVQYIQLHMNYMRMLNRNVHRCNEKTVKD
jgi:hypothetical protein